MLKILVRVFSAWTVSSAITAHVYIVVFYFVLHGKRNNSDDESIKCTCTRIIILTVNALVQEYDKNYLFKIHFAKNSNKLNRTMLYRRGVLFIKIIKSGLYIFLLHYKIVMLFFPFKICKQSDHHADQYISQYYRFYQRFNAPAHFTGRYCGLIPAVYLGRGENGTVIPLPSCGFFLQIVVVYHLYLTWKLHKCEYMHEVRL